jgi:opacity protein-like surface antigen
MVGYAIDPTLMVFAGAGAAVADVRLYSASAGGVRDYNTVVGMTLFDSPIETRHVGLSVSVGAQKQVSSGISIRAELLHDSYAPMEVDAWKGLVLDVGGITAGLGPDTVALSRTAVRASVIFGF